MEARQPAEGHDRDTCGIHLECLIEQHRDAYRADLRIPRLVARQPPTTFNRRRHRPEVELGAMVGMPMSGRLLRRLGHPDDFGSDFPWTRAFWLLRDWCRQEHPYHRGADSPWWRGALCQQVVRFIVIEGYDLPATAAILRYDHPAPVLRAALTQIEVLMDVARERAERKAGEMAGRFSVINPARLPSHHAVPGLHQQECPQCVTT